MAFRLLVALTCLALCHSSPVFLNGYLYRDGRSYSMGQGYGGNRATGSATINGNVVQAYGSAINDNQFARNTYGEAYPGQLVAQAQAIDDQNTYGGAKALAEAQNAPTHTYYTVPAPATIVSYEQNFEAPSQGSYEMVPGGIAAESNAVVSDNSESSVSSVKSDGSGSAQSSAQTNGMGSYGVTSSNANTFGSNIGAASSNANTAYGSSVTAAKTQGYGVASSKSQGNVGQTSSQSQTHGGFGSASSNVNEAQESAVASANTQGFGSASSDANINNGVARKGWRFGLLYDTPAHESVHADSHSGIGGVAKSTAQANNAGYGTAHTTANSQGTGASNSHVNFNGAGFMHRNADSNLGYGSINSAANTHGYGTANSAADVNEFGAIKSTVNTQGYGTANSDANNGYGSIKSIANTQGYGTANSGADVNNAGIQATANTNGLGSASSTANTGATYGALKAYVPYGSRSTVNAHTTGTGSAAARSQGLQTGYKVINSSANSSGIGTAHANAHSL